MGSLDVGGTTYSISLFDTAGREDYDRMRPLSYPGSRICLICYSITSVETLNRVASLYIHEIRHHLPNIPIILVGCKIDLRDDPETIARLKEKNMAFVTYKQGMEVAKSLNIERFMECSALKYIGINEIFAEAVRLAAHAPKKTKEKSGKCVLL
eukprot:Phypoly_transcript_23590.p1 GENE.Phypoly_transcript_23590~~Phypoly_transcript_23590.p1  ORF type:complete len:175 (+),score=14.16 Phypoly_transcript_23590:65-526(+)